VVKAFLLRTSRLQLCDRRHGERRLARLCLVMANAGALGAVDAVTAAGPDVPVPQTQLRLLCGRAGTLPCPPDLRSLWLPYAR
jgi:hypothetical protein